MARRRSEPPNPTANNVRRVRGEVALMRSVAAHGMTEVVAAEHGYRSVLALRRAVERARDRACPHPRPLSINPDYDLLDELQAGQFPLACRGDVEAHAVLLAATKLGLALLDAQIASVSEPQFPDGDDPGPVGAERGEWTEGLELRSNNRSYRTIAKRLGLDDWLAALVMVYRDLDAFYMAAAAELRRVQLAEIDHGLATHYAARHRQFPVAFAARAVALLRRRAQIRGLLLTPPGWWLDPCPPSVIRIP